VSDYMYTRTDRKYSCPVTITLQTDYCYCLSPPSWCPCRRRPSSLPSTRGWRRAWGHPGQACRGHSGPGAGEGVPLDVPGELAPYLGRGASSRAPVEEEEEGTPRGKAERTRGGMGRAGGGKGRGAREEGGVADGGIPAVLCPCCPGAECRGPPPAAAPRRAVAHPAPPAVLQLALPGALGAPLQCPVCPWHTGGPPAGVRP